MVYITLFDKQCVIHKAHLPQGKPVNSKAQEPSGLFKQIVRKKASWFPLHYNVSVHSAVKEERFLASCDVFVNPPYSPNLVPDVFDFTTAKNTPQTKNVSAGQGHQ